MIKELIDSGKIGNLQYIYSNRLNLGQVRTEENVFWSFAPHDISILQFLTESFPVDINTMGGAFLQDDIHDSTITFLSYPNNIKAHIYLSWLHPFKEHRIVIIGSKGMISFEDSLDSKPLKFYDKKFIRNKNNFEKIDGKIEKIDYEESAPLEEELKYFVNNLDEGDFKISNGENGLEVIRMMFPSEIIVNDSAIVPDNVNIIPLFTSSNQSTSMEEFFNLSPDPNANPSFRQLHESGKTAR